MTKEAYEQLRNFLERTLVNRLYVTVTQTSRLFSAGCEHHALE